MANIGSVVEGIKFLDVYKSAGHFAVHVKHEWVHASRQKRKYSANQQQYFIQPVTIFKLAAEQWLILKYKKDSKLFNFTSSITVGSLFSSDFGLSLSELGRIIV